MRERNVRPQASLSNILEGNGGSRSAIACQHRGRGADPRPIRAPPPMTRSGPPLHCSTITASFGHAADPVQVPDLLNTHHRRRPRSIGIAQECSSCKRASRSFHSQPYRMPRLRPPWPARRSRLRPQLPTPKAGMQNFSLNVSHCFFAGTSPTSSCADTVWKVTSHTYS